MKSETFQIRCELKLAYAVSTLLSTKVVSEMFSYNSYLIAHLQAFVARFSLHQIDYAM